MPRSDAGRRSIPARLLIALGVAAQLLAALALAAVDPVLEYAVLAPEVRSVRTEDGESRVDSGLEKYLDAREDVEEQLGTAVAALSASGWKGAASVSHGGGTREAALRAVGERWQEICPRVIRTGRWMDGAELSRGARVAVLDEDLAFVLYGSENAEGSEIDIEGETYRVLGTVAHVRSVGEADAYSAYIPLAAASEQGIQLDTLTMCALSAVPSGLDQSFTEAMRTAWGPGELHNLRKERMGALLLSRLLVCAFGFALAFALGRKLAALLCRWRAQIDERRRHCYVWRWIWPALARALAGLLCAAALLGGVYALMCFGIEPVYSFTEWVPESLVSASALRTVFWSRAAQAARPIAIATPESARIAFWGALDRAGAVALLLGLALGKRKRRSAPEPEEPHPRAGEPSTDQTLQDRA